MDGFEILTFFSNTFRVSEDIFTWPNVVFRFIIPMIASVIMWYTLLHKGVKIIRNSGINLFLALIFSIFMIPFVSLVPAQFFLLIAIEMFIFWSGITSWKKLLAGAIVGVLIFFGYPYLVTLLESNLNY